MTPCAWRWGSNGKGIGGHVGASCNDKRSSMVESANQKAWGDVTCMGWSTTGTVDGNILSHELWWCMPTSMSSWLRTPMRHLGYCNRAVCVRVQWPQKAAGYSGPHHSVWRSTKAQEEGTTTRQRTRLSVLWSNMIHGDLNTVWSRSRALLEAGYAISVKVACYGV